MSGQFEEAVGIRRGDRDVELPGYEILTGWLMRVPDTWLPGLLRRIVALCVMRGVFREGGLEHTVAAAKQVGENPEEAILRGLECRGNSSGASSGERALQ